MNKIIKTKNKTITLHLFTIKNMHFFVISAVLEEKNSSVSCRINLKKRSKIFCVQWIITFSCRLIVRYVLQLTSNFHEDSSKGVFCLAPRR